MLLTSRKIRKIKLNEDKFKGLSRPEIRQLVEQEVCDFYEVKLEMLRTKSRRRIYVMPRQLIMFLLEYYTEWSQLQIGSFYGGRDHTTVYHSRETIEDFLSHKTYTPVKEELNNFLFKYGYRTLAAEQQEVKKAVAIDTYY